MNWSWAYMRGGGNARVRVTGNVFPYIVTLQNFLMTSKHAISEQQIYTERCKLDSAPPSSDYVYVAPQSGVHKSIYKKIRASTTSDNESSWVSAEDSFCLPSHELTTGGMCAKSHLCQKRLI